MMMEARQPSQVCNRVRFPSLSLCVWYKWYNKQSKYSLEKLAQRNAPLIIIIIILNSILIAFIVPD